MNQAAPSPEATRAQEPAVSNQPHAGTPPDPAPPGYPGQPAPQPQYGQPQYGAPTNYLGGPGYVDATSGPRGLSLSSMIIGLTSLFIAGWFIVPQIVGIVLGHIGLSRESPQGRPFSITGLVTNYLALLIYVGIYAFFIYLAASLTTYSTGTGDTWS
jgi:hypothetical protein